MDLSAQLEEDFRGLPGKGAGRKGLEDVWAGRRSLEGLGVRLPAVIDGDADRRLYEWLTAEHGVEGAHGKFNGWIRELVSFERGLERRRSSRK